jgi:hypothetical protein
MMLLHDSRREARFGDGELVLLGDQDRSRWNTEQIAALYGQLGRLTGLPVVETERPEVGLRIVGQRKQDSPD